MGRVDSGSESRRSESEPEEEEEEEEEEGLFKANAVESRNTGLRYKIE